MATDPGPALSRQDCALPSRQRERILVLGLVVLLTIYRSAVLSFFEGADFDSDQALIGLMAKHLAEGRAFPVFTYAQPYMLGVEAWMAAPFFLIGGPTVQMLKLPLLLVNVATAVLLVRLLERQCGLRPVVALVPALFFVVMPIGPVVLLLEASGGNVEPFLYVLLLWMLRNRPLGFGAVLAFGVLQREFTIHALVALAVLSVADRTLFRRENWRPLLAGLVSFSAMWQGIYLLKQYSAIDGPGTSPDRVLTAGSDNVVALLSRTCLDGALLLERLPALATTYLADMFGGRVRPMGRFGVNTLLRLGADWLWPLLGTAFLLALLRVAWLSWRYGIRPWEPPVRFAAYLWLVGASAIGGHYVLRCGEVVLETMRYSVLGAFTAVGLVAAFLTIEPRRWARSALVAVVLVWAGASLADHSRLLAQYLWDRPVNARRLLADHLVERGIRFARADFWDALSTTFYAEERVIVASTTNVFLTEYQWLVDRNPDEAYWIRRRPCEGGTSVANWLHVCPPNRWRTPVVTPAGP